MKIYLSIDCGLKGGLTLWNDTKYSHSVNMPIKNGSLDMKKIGELMATVDTVIIEHQFSPHSKNQKGMQTNLENFGKLKGATELLGKELHEVNASEWVTALGLSNRGRSPMLPKLTKADRAKKSNKLIGTSFLSKEDGKADSALIGIYWFKKNKLWGK